MNTLVIVLIAAVCLFGAYTLYGRWLANKWGIDPKAKTPAVVHEDGRDYVPTNGWTVFAHQFSSIAGAGPVTGAIQAAAFGWLPVLLWVLLGGIFFGAVTDFGALYASVKNDGKSMGMLIEKYIGKTGRKLFLLFCWLFCGIVIAAFADMVAGTFNAFGADGALVEAAQTNGAAGMVSIMFMVFAVIFGLLQKNLHFTGWKENVISIVFIVLSFVVGANFHIILGKAAWSYITFVYIFFAAVLPMWLLKQPRDHMTTFMFVAMIIGAVVGLLGGPVGVLLGAGIGLVAGMAMDDKDIDDDDSLMEYCASELTPGATALVMLAKEDSEDALDAQFDETCIIYRWDADEVNAEVERGEALRDSLAAETRKQLREARKEARKARREARKDK